MNKLINSNITPEDLFGHAIRNLHSVENVFIRNKNLYRGITLVQQLRVLNCSMTTANK